LRKEQKVLEGLQARIKKMEEEIRPMAEETGETVLLL
jgi:uncharacterized protein YktB (UPF0637 family)